MSRLPRDAVKTTSIVLLILLITILHYRTSTEHRYDAGWTARSTRR